MPGRRDAIHILTAATLGSESFADNIGSGATLRLGRST